MLESVGFSIGLTSTRPQAARGHAVVVVAPITSKKVERVVPFEARVDDEALGLDFPSKAMLNQIRTVSKSRIAGFYGVADIATMRAVDAALKITLGL